MNIGIDITLGWHWALLFNNLPALMFYAMIVVFVGMVVGGRSGMTKLLGVGLALGTLGLIGVSTGWTPSSEWLWRTFLTIGFVATVVGAIGSAIHARRH